MNISLDTALNIIGLSITILGPIAGAVFALYNHYNYSWKKILGAVKLLHQKLIERGTEPTLILAFAKGGLILADLIGQQFGNRIPICTIFSKRTLKNGERIVEIDTTYVNLSNIKSKKILIVDDVIQSGGSLLAIVKLLTEQYGVKRKDITIAVLATTTSVTVFQPDVYVYEFEYGKKRPVLPWGQVPRD